MHVEFFLSLFTTVFTETCEIGTFENSEILVESVFGQYSFANAKKWKYSFLFSGESSQRFNRKHIYSLYNCVICGEHNHDNIVCLPLYVFYMYCNHFEEKFHQHLSVINVPPKNICCIIGNSGANDRNTFLDKLDKEVQIDYAGSYKNNVPRIYPAYNTPEFVNLVSKYKIIITMENSKEDMYITEKITHGFIAGNIPVYWGSDNIHDYFNKDRFINVENMSDSCINYTINRITPFRIENAQRQRYLSLIYANKVGVLNEKRCKSILNDEDEYLNMVNSPIIVDENIIRSINNIAIDIRKCIGLLGSTVLSKKY
jgi:hypothetical protein